MAKLLLIDDEEGIRKILGMSLRSDGYEVVTAEDGRQGLDLFREGRFPIVLTDLKMPELDGIEVLKRIKEIEPSAEVIIITGHGNMEAAVQSLYLGASNFVTKPVNDQILSAALKKAEQRVEMDRMLRDCTQNLEAMVKEVAEEIRRRYEFESKLIQRWIEGIIATDNEGNIVVFNPTAENIFGYSQDEAKSTKKANDIYPEKIMQKIADVFSGKKDRGDDIFTEEHTSILGKNGEPVPVRISGAILYEADKPIGSVGFFQDLREIKELREEFLPEDA
ncbi:MAG: response regulator [Desulfovibrionales bacterium]|nr:response regulator [Desulfovibrionales bacterium]